MDLSDKDIELLEKLFFDKLSIEEEAQLNQLMKSADFKKEAETYLQIFLRIQEEVQLDIKNKMKVWDEKYKQSPSTPTKRTIGFGWLKYAAILVILASAVFYFLKDSNQLTLESYYEVYPDVVTTRDSSNNPELSKAMSEYQKRNYQIVIDILEKDRIPLVEYQFYLAQSYFGIEKYQKASELFKELSEGTSNFANTSEWYYSLCQVKLDKSSGILYLEKLVEEKSSYADKAKDLLFLLK